MRWRSLLAVTVVVLAAGLAWVAPASAQSGVRLSGTAGWSGRCHDGRPLLVRARIVADRLVSGVLSAEPNGPPTPATEVAVEVAGGSEEEVTLVVASPFGCGGVTLRLQEDGTTTTAQVGTSGAGDTVLLGLLPGVRPAGALPASALARTGVAAVAALEPELLDQTGAVAGLDSIGATAADLDGLSAEQSRALATWVADGGTLLVDADRPEELGRLPEAWRPKAGGRVGAGRGQVALTGRALRDGRLDGMAEPGVVAWADGRGFGFDSGGELQTTLRRRSGLRVLSLPMILGALVLYVLLVGPGVRVGLRRLGRLQLTWLVVPVAALSFSGLAVAGGDLLRRGGKPSHLSVIETDVAGSRSRTFVGVPTRTKGDVTADLPSGWLAGGLGFDSQAGRSTVRVTPGGRRLSTPGIPGGYVVLAAAGPSAVEGRLTVDLGSTTGQATVRNELPVALEDVALFAPGGVVSVGRLEAGATAPVTVPAGGRREDPRSQAHDVWNEADDRLGSADAFLLLADVEQAQTSATVMAAGWTDRLAAPMGLRGGRPGGTTLVLGRAATGSSTGSLVGTSNEGVATVRFVVPPGAPYRLVWDIATFGMPPDVQGPHVQGLPVQVLVNGRWVPVAHRSQLPDGATADGVVYVRTPVFQPLLPALEAL